MTSLNRWVPRLIIGSALLHFVWAFVEPNTFGSIASEGFFATVQDTDAADYERSADMWYLMCGIGLLAMGTLTAKLARAVGRVPAQTGVYLIVLGITVSVIFFPANPGPLLFVIGVLALIAAAHHPVNTQATAADLRAVS